MIRRWKTEEQFERRGEEEVEEERDRWKKKLVDRCPMVTGECSFRQMRHGSGEEWKNFGY